MLYVAIVNLPPNRMKKILSSLLALSIPLFAFSTDYYYQGGNYELFGKLEYTF